MNSKAIKRQLLAAIAMVLVAAIALGSSTYAWFVASGSVEAKGMKVQAQAESGLLIRGVSFDSAQNKWVGDDWATSANARDTATKDLHPTSTINLTDWYKASSNSANNALAKQDVAVNPDAYTKVSNDILNTYRRLDTFAIRSASGVDLEDIRLAVKSVSATTTGTTTGALNQSIRVGVKMATGAGRDANGTTETGETFYIFAPNITGTSFELTANYASAATLTEYKEASSTRDYLYISDDTVPFAEAGVRVEIYTWYEGEDEGCKTANITDNTGAALDADDLSITVVFEKSDLPA